MTRKVVNLALQGGGAHGAFTWGALDRLLEDEQIDIEGITATSAGAMNAAALKHGWVLGGRDGARESLDRFWLRLAGLDGPGHVYVVEPTGPFEDDPNVTDKKFPGNPTGSYRTRHPLRVVAELADWTPHPPEAVQGMLAGLAQLREQGRDVIED